MKRTELTSLITSEVWLVIIAIISCVYVFVFRNGKMIIPILFFAVTFCILAFMFVMMHLWKQLLKTKGYLLFIIIIGFFLSYLFLLFPNNTTIKLGCVYFAACYLAYQFRMIFGLALCGSFFVMSYILNGTCAKDEIGVFILALVACVIGRLINSRKTFWISQVLMVTLQWIVLLVINRFMLADTFSLWHTASVFIYMPIMFLTYWSEEKFSKLFLTDEVLNICNDEDAKEKQPRKRKKTKKDKNMVINQETTEYADLEILVLDSFELISNMKKTLPKLYKHSCEIAVLSSYVANELEADAILAYAGGLYHDIGHNEKKEFDDAGIRIAYDYSFPPRLIELLIPFNRKEILPAFIEAVIVVLSDNIITMYHFIKKSKKDVSMEKLINNTFELHQKKGIIESSGITKDEYGKMKKAFVRRLITEGTMSDLVNQ